MASRKHITPVQRLGSWNGSGFEAVAADSVDANKVFVITHGWAPGMRSAVEAANGVLLAWDEDAATESGKRYDTWFAPMATEIARIVPDATVLAFSWIDQSATKPGNIRAIRSQMRTTVNGQRLAVALETALADGAEPGIHLIGFSHGARVVTIAATVMEPTPHQVTLLDSPEGALPIAGGALNDLTSYLRILTRPGEGLYETDVDNYPSHFGVRYGRHPGLHRVVDVELDPEGHPLDPGAERPATIGATASAYHLYAPQWYVETARRDLDVGFGWSRLGDRAPWPAEAEHRQTEDGDPFNLEPVDRGESGDTAGEMVDRVRDAVERPLVLSTQGQRTLSHVAWRHRGDILAVLPIHWVDAPPSASVHIFVGGRERSSAVRGWTDAADQKVAVPLGDVRRGPVGVLVRLDSDEPATVEIERATSIYQLPLPAFAEYRTWLFPAFVTTVAVAGTAAALLGAWSAFRLGRWVGSSVRG